MLFSELKWSHSVSHPLSVFMNDQNTSNFSSTGVFIYSVALDFPDVTGVIMWAAYFSGDDIVDYPRPALTLSGDIDGQTLITTIATSFQ